MEAGELSRIEKELIQNWKGTPTEIIHDREEAGEPNRDFADEQNPRFSGKILQWVLGSCRC